MIRLFEAIAQWWTGSDHALKIGTPIPRFTGHDESKHLAAARRRAIADDLQRERAQIVSGSERPRRIYRVERSS